MPCGYQSSTLVHYQPDCPVKSWAVLSNNGNTCLKIFFFKKNFMMVSLGVFEYIVGHHHNIQKSKSINLLMHFHHASHSMSLAQYCPSPVCHYLRLLVLRGADFLTPTEPYVSCHNSEFPHRSGKEIRNRAYHLHWMTTKHKIYQPRVMICSLTQFEKC